MLQNFRDTPLAFFLGIIPRHEHIIDFYGSPLPRKFLGDFGQKFVKFAFVDNGYTIHYQRVVESIVEMHLVSKSS
jgi:hypothetical protein